MEGGSQLTVRKSNWQWTTGAVHICALTATCDSQRAGQTCRSEDFIDGPTRAHGDRPNVLGLLGLRSICSCPRRRQSLPSKTPRDTGAEKGARSGAGLCIRIIFAEMLSKVRMVLLTTLDFSQHSKATAWVESLRHGRRFKR